MEQQIYNLKRQNDVMESQFVDKLRHLQDYTEQQKFNKHTYN
jgi:hypothetical protein